MIALIDADTEITGTIWFDHSGYPVVSIGHQQQILLHRFIVEKALQRKLKSTEHVHHINKNKLDVRRKNLVVCSDSYHKLLHARQDILDDGFDPNLHHYCTACKTYHVKEYFPKYKNSWAGLGSMCRKESNRRRRGKGYHKFTWRECMHQQFRRAVKKGLVSSLTKEGRCL